MLQALLPGLISAGSSLLGGFLNRDAQKDANAVNAANADKQIALQREFAQNAIQWKAADAEKAGIHPAFAMGASTTSFSPVSVGAIPETGVGTGLANMGQDISRSVAAFRSPGEKVGGALTAQQVAGNELDLETKKLNNQLLQIKITQALGQPGTPPGLPPGAFEVPENPKSEQRPPLMISGNRWLTNPNTSPMKAWEDQYGDEGPASWLLPPVIAANDAAYNIRRKYLGAETSRQAADNLVQGFGSATASLARYYQAAKNAYFNRDHALPVRPSYAPPRGR